MKINIKYYIISLLVIVACSNKINAQDKIDSVAFKLLDKSLGFISDEQSAAIYFEEIAFGLDNPADIFTLPAYKVFLGGFWIVDSNKFEMQLGFNKGLCDGKLVVYVDEQSGTIIIDSLRHTTPLFEKEKAPDINKVLTDMFGEGTLTYLGKEVINGKECHKIKSEFKDYDNMHVLYWIEVKTGKLYLMAEWQNQSYDVYRIKSIGKAPANYKYTVNFPNKELEEFHGYNVFDMRFVRKDYESK